MDLSYANKSWKLKKDFDLAFRCHSSGFQSSSVRSVYIKIIYHSGMKSANFKNTNANYTTCTGKPHKYINKDKIYDGL